MGYFSWMFANCNNEKNLRVGRKGYVACPDNTFIEEPNYEGYGDFDGKDVYELVVQWNRKFLADHPEHILPRFHIRVDRFPWYPALADLTIPLYEIPERSKPDWDGELRMIGIDIACYNEDNASLAYPIKIVSNKKMAYDDLPPSKLDPDQGCL